MGNELTAMRSFLPQIKSSEAVAKSAALFFIVLNVGATAAFILYAKSQLAEGHNWGDDFGLYLQLADNIRAGRPYNYLNTGIQVPPGFPALLAGWETLFGQSFVALKSLNIVSWVAAAWLASLFAARTLGRVAASFVLIAHFVLPAYYLQQQSVLSDPPFMVAVNLLVLLCFFYFRAPGSRPWAVFALLCSASAALFCAILIRPAGLPLVAAIVLASGLQAYIARKDHTQVLRGVALAAGAIGVFALYMRAFGASSTTHLALALGGAEEPGTGLFSVLTHLVLRRTGEELLNLSVLIGLHPSIGTGSLLAVGILAGACAFLFLTRDFVAPLILIAYAGMLLLIPWQQGYRYLLPMTSLVLIFVTALPSLAWQYLRIERYFFPAAAGMVVALCFVLIVADDMVQGVRGTYGYNDDETSGPRTKELVSWLKQNTRPDDQLCSFKPRAVMFFAGRRAYHLPNDVTEDIGVWLRQRQSEYAVLITRPAYGYARLDGVLRTSEAVTEVFRNEDYAVFKLRRE
jgi:hypothetical protein